MSDVININELDAWLFEHAQVMGHKCDGVKGKSPDGEQCNIAWIDTATGERIDIVWANTIPG